MEMNIRSRKGISMVEVVVALVVITIISLATLSVVFVSAKVESKTAVVIEVRNCAENAVECFRFANGDKRIFENCLNKSVGAELWQVDGHKYSYKTGKYTVVIELAYDQNKLIGFVFAANDAAGADIYQFTFTNGGEQE